MKQLSLIFFCSLLSACALFGPVKTRPVTSYLIDTVPSVPTKATRRPVTLVVLLPETSAAYNTTQMAYTTQAHQIAYFALHRWAETPPRMLQPLIIETLQNTRSFYASATATRSHYLLNTQLLKLEQAFSHQAPSREIVSVRAQLVNPQGVVIASKQFRVSVAAPEDTPYGGVIAANQAVASILKQLTLFCLTAIGPNNNLS